MCTLCFTRMPGESYSHIVKPARNVHFLECCFSLVYITVRLGAGRPMTFFLLVGNP